MEDIAQWSYSATHYDGLLRGKGVEIQTHPQKGKFLIATRDVEKGAILFEESPICCTQYLDEFNSGVPICAHCLKSVETPEEIVTRVAGREVAASLPTIPGWTPPHRCHCRSASASPSECKAVYCSQECERESWSRQHRLLCPHTMSADAAAAYAEFLKAPWQVGRIDFTDPHFLCLKAVATALVNHRYGGQPLEVAYQFVMQLARAPLPRFKLSCLILPTYENEEAAPTSAEYEELEVRRLRKWQQFTKYRNTVHPHTDDPLVAWSLNSNPCTPEDIIAQAVALIHRIFEMSEAERSYFDPARWSESIGATLMNAHRRLPNSRCSYDDFCDLAKQSPDGIAAQKAFTKELRSAGVDPRGFESYSHGLGFFVVGACMNHSCDPNVHVSHTHHRDATLCLVALKDVRAGEELFISYIEETDHVFVRQQHLFEQYMFACDCARCGKELALEASLS